MGTGVAFPPWPPENRAPAEAGRESIVLDVGLFGRPLLRPLPLARVSLENGQASRRISTGRLNGSPRLHLRPIEVVVFNLPSGGLRPGRSCLGGGLALRCIQRLSFPHIATQRCRWRDNWNTRGASFPVLSYWGMFSSNLLRPQRIWTELSHDVLNPARVPL